MDNSPPVGPPLLARDAGKQSAGRKLLVSAALLSSAALFGAICARGLLAEKGAAGWALVAITALSFFLCVWLSARTLRHGHLNRVELYADRILVSDAQPRPSEFHFSDVTEIGWNVGDRCVYVNLRGHFLGRVIDSKHFNDDAEARAFVARANEALRLFRQRPSTGSSVRMTG